jgi:glycerol-3-phosphate dehydrogenase
LTADGYITSVLVVDENLDMQKTDNVGTRASRLDEFGASGFDLLVVGGGITGAGVARDAVMRGLKVALVEQSDYAFGTSSRSSKLVHGGLRYLENMEFGLVFESLRERYIQRKLHPNLVWPMPFLFPVYEGEKPGLRLMSLGLWLYDLLALFRSHRIHKTLSAAKVSDLVPGLKSEGLVGGVHYHDCRTDDARLTLLNVFSAQREGATVSNYVRFEAPRFNDRGSVQGAVLTDQLSGRQFEVATRHIVYAAGPWTDRLKEAPGGGRLLRTTKGVHIVVARERCPVDAVVVMKSPQDRRIVFAVPWGDKVYLGTTDTDFNDHPDGVSVTDEDAEYILETSNRFFPAAKLAKTDIKGAWAGLRPLIRTDAETAYKTSREHEVFVDPRGITTVAGGKLTTYRSMAKEVVDKVAKELKSAHGVASRRCRTRKVAADPFLDRDHVLGEDPLADALWGSVGGAAPWILERMKTHPEEAVPFVEDAPHVMAQVSWAVLGEHAERLSDVLMRRLSLAYQDQSVVDAIAHQVVQHMARLLGRDSTWIEAELTAFAVERLGLEAVAS